MVIPGQSLTSIALLATKRLSFIAKGFAKAEGLTVILCHIVISYPYIDRDFVGKRT